MPAWTLVASLDASLDYCASLDRRVLYVDSVVSHLARQGGGWHETVRHSPKIPLASGIVDRFVRERGTDD
jgi:hypothetical protein